MYGATEYRATNIFSLAVEGNRGVSEALACEALAKAEVDWGQEVTDQAVRKFGSDPALTFPEWARRARYLERRGFGQDAIRLAIGNFERSTET